MLPFLIQECLPPDLVQMQLGSNFFNGPTPLPSRFSARMIEYSIYDNRFSGALPREGWGILKGLRRLYLHGNELSGLIPETMCSVVDIETDCAMQENFFSSPVPQCLPARCKAGTRKHARSDMVTRADVATERFDLHTTGMDLPGQIVWQMVSGGGEHTCGITATGDLHCWGNNESNQTAVPRNVSSWQSVSAGDAATTCAITEQDQQLHCWGADEHGQATVPKQLTATRFTAVSVGRYHACAILQSNHSVVCWGSGKEGQTAPPSDVTAWSSLSCGAHFCCGLTQLDSEVRCWGCGPQNCYKFCHGQASPPSRLGASSVAAGGYAACALSFSQSGQSRQTGGDALICWGTDINGEISPPPRFGCVRQVSMSRYGGCALSVVGRIFCWGVQGLCHEGHYNASKGHCDKSVVTAPRLPRGSRGWMALDLGAWHGCAITDIGALRCWGSDESGQSTPPTSVDMMQIV